MATKKILQLPAIQGIAASSAAGTTGIFDLPLNYRYNRIDIIYIDTNATGANVPDIAYDHEVQFGTSTGILGDIVLNRNGKAQRVHAANELDALNTLNGSQYGRGALKNVVNSSTRQVLPIFFAEPWRKDKADTDYMAWSANAANGFATFQLKITLANAMPATGSLAAIAYVDDPLPPPSGGAQSVKKVYRHDLSAGGAANDFANVLDARDAYQLIYLKNPTGTYVQKVTLKMNGVLFRDAINNRDNIGARVSTGMNPPAITGSTPGAQAETALNFGYPIVFDYDDPLNSALPAPVSPWLHVDYAGTATTTVRALIERLGPLD